MDHFQQIGVIGAPEEPMLEAYTLLGALAPVTSTIRLGSLVTGTVYRNPALLAKIVTTLDVVSHGRAVLGIGAAWNEQEATEYGYDWPGTGERMDRLEDALRICRAMFTRERATVEGIHTSVHDALNVPQPLQPGGPPILIGGGGERRTLRLVAQYADACNLFGDVATVRHKLDVLDRHCADVGRDPAAVTRTRYVTLVAAATTGEAQDRFDRLPGTDGFGPDPSGYYAVGDPDAICAHVAPFLEAGVDGIVFGLAPGTSPDDVARTGRALVERFGTAATATT
jgi:F420-dependent oxidoreductase-like protein